MFLGEIQQNKIAKSDIYRNIGKLSKEVSSLQTKIKYTVRLYDCSYSFSSNSCCLFFF